MSAPLLGQDGRINRGVDPSVLQSAAAANPHNPSVIASQFGALALPSPPGGGEQPVAQGPGNQPPAPGAAQPTAGGGDQQPASDDGLISTSSDLAAMFDGVENPEQLFNAVTHQIGDREYTLSEIVDGFSAQPEARAVAAQRDTLESEFVQRSQVQRQAHDAAMGIVADLQSQLAAQISQDESPERLSRLLAADPVAYQAKNLEIQTRKQAAANAKAELDRQKESRDRTEREEFDRFRSTEAQRLAERFPEWNDLSAGPTVKAKLSTYARNMGFSDTELANIADHRFLLVLRDAAMGSEMTTKGVRAIKDARDRKLPAPAAKPNARGEVPGVREQNNSGRAASFKKLQQDQSVAAAADLFTRMIQ